MFPDSFLQTEGWEALQRNLGRRTWRMRMDSGESITFIRYPLPFGKNYLYCPRGPVRADIVSCIDAARTLAAQEHAVFFRFEPNDIDSDVVRNELVARGARHIREVQPESTLVLDLTKSEEKLLIEMEYATRYSIRAATKRGVRVAFAATPHEKEKAFGLFWPLFHTTQARHSLARYTESYYRAVTQLEGTPHSALALARVGEEVIAGALLLYHGNTATYLFAASKAGYGRFNAPTLIIWEAMLRAKSQGYLMFDLWGVNEHNPRWQHITAFKKSFGGREVHYAGTWDLPIHKSLYWLYRFVKRIL